MNYLITFIYLVSCFYLFFEGPLDQTNVYVKLFFLIFGTAIVNELASMKKNKPTKKTKTQTDKNNEIPLDRRKPIEELIHMPLEKMNGHEFEELCYHYFKARFKHVEKTSDSKDKGVDLIYVDKEGFKTAVQCKHYLNSNTKVGSPDINRLEGAKRSYRCQRTHFITTSDFSPAGREAANDCQMKLWHYSMVKRYIVAWKEKEANKVSTVK